MSAINDFLLRSRITIAQNPCVSPDFCLDWGALQKNLASGAGITTHAMSAFDIAAGRLALAEDAAFLMEKGIALDRRRYTVTLHHNDFLIDAYFEGGRANVRSADKRTATTQTGVPRKSQVVDTVEEAIEIMAQYLADETH